VNGQLHAPAELPREGAPSNHCAREYQGGVLNLSGRLGEVKNLVAPAGVEQRFLTPPVHIIAITRPGYPGCLRLCKKLL
jgi:hypothetical protein